MEKYLYETLRLLKNIDDTFKLNEIDDEWYGYFKKDVKKFGKQKNDFVKFLKKMSKEDSNIHTRDILWTLVFAYRDFCYELGYFEKRAKDVLHELEKLK